VLLPRHGDMRTLPRLTVYKLRASDARMEPKCNHDCGTLTTYVMMHARCSHDAILQIAIWYHMAFPSIAFPHLVARPDDVRVTNVSLCTNNSDFHFRAAD
jgi:hypothetical protein